MISIRNILKLQGKSLLRCVNFTLVGTKFTETVQYSQKTCDLFNSLFLQQSLQIKSSKQVNQLLLGCLFSRIIGNNMPLSIYMSQSVNFKREVQIGEKVTGQVQIVKNLGKRRYELRTTCFNHGNEIVMEGIAIILQE